MQGARRLAGDRPYVKWIPRLHVRQSRNLGG